MFIYFNIELMLYINYVTNIYCIEYINNITTIINMSNM